jgi:hypothetical protein
MNTNRIKQLFVRLAKDLSVPSDPGVRQPKGPRMLDRSLVVRGSLVLEGQFADCFMSALENICSEVLRDETPWSRASVDDLVTESLSNVLTVASENREDAIRAESNRLLARLKDQPDEWEVEFSIGGMQTDCHGFAFGRVQFVCDAIQLPVPMSGLTDEAGWVRSMFARLRVRAIDQQSAIPIAENELDRLLAVLNALCANSPPSLFRIHRGQPENPFRYQVNRARRTSKAKPLTRFGSHRVGVDISRDQLNTQLKSRGGDLVCDLLTRDDSFAARLLNGFALAGAASVEQQPQVSFLLFAIALESTVLGGQIKEGLTYKLCTRVAHLLAVSVDRRRKLVAEVDELYRIRSVLVHKGEDRVAKSDLVRIWQICMYALHILNSLPAFRAMTTSEQLEQWFEDRVLGMRDAAEGT